MALYGPRSAVTGTRPMPDLALLHTELRRPGVTLLLLHMEYLEKHPDGYRYTAFCERYNAWLSRHSPVMRQTHVAGDKLFVDYSGDTPHIVDSLTGEVRKVELFVAVLGASNLTFAEATRTQTMADRTASHVRAFEYLGGVPCAVGPDQLKSGVSSSCRYEPGVQRTYDELAEHYGTTALPARPAHPRDKAKVEAGVLIAQRWILARLRHHISTSTLARRWFSMRIHPVAARLLSIMSSRRTNLDGEKPTVIPASLMGHGLRRLPRRSSNLLASVSDAVERTKAALRASSASFGHFQLAHYSS